MPHEELRKELDFLKKKTSEIELMLAVSRMSETTDNTHELLVKYVIEVCEKNNWQLGQIYQKQSDHTWQRISIVDCLNPSKPKEIPAQKTFSEDFVTSRFPVWNEGSDIAISLSNLEDSIPHDKLRSLVTRYGIPLSSAHAKLFLEFFFTTDSISNSDNFCLIQLSAKHLLDTIEKKALEIELKENYEQLNTSINDLQTAKKSLELVNEKLKISEQKSRESNEAKSKFLSNITHELRTPLTSIIGYSEHVANSINTISPENLYQFKHKLEKEIDAIHRNGIHLMQIINDILDLSKIESGNMNLENVEYSLYKIIFDCEVIFRVQAESKNLEVEILYDLPLPKIVTTDPVRVKQVLLNLCSNAIKFTQEGKIVIRISYVQDHNLIKFEVTDSGIGIEESKLNIIFDSFTQATNSTTRKYGGTGLGLSICKQLVTMLGGEIHATSEIGKYSTFTFTVRPQEIPMELVTSLDEFMAVETQELKTIETPKLVGSILVVDDWQDNLDLIELFLEDTTINLTTAKSGEEAVELVQNLNPDLIVMDLKMTGMDGLTATKLIRESKYSNPIIAFSANITRDNISDIMKVGFTDFMVKPIDRDNFFYVLSKYLTNKPKANTNKQSASPKSQKFFESDKYKQLVQKFINNLPDIHKKLEEANQNNNNQDIYQLCHTLKGSGSSFNCDSLTEIASNVCETIHNDNNQQEISNSVHILLKEIDSTYNNHQKN